MVYQDFALCGNLDVASNIYLGRWPTRGVFVRAGWMDVETHRILTGLGVDTDIARQKVETLSGGRQQMVAIARAISFDPRLVILDEPTANLSVTATEHVLALVLELKRQGVAQIVISHRLQDIFAVGDRVMVLKRGRNVGERLDPGHDGSRGPVTDRPGRRLRVRPPGLSHRSGDGIGPPDVVATTERITLGTDRAAHRPGSARLRGRQGTPRAPGPSDRVDRRCQRVSGARSFPPNRR